MLGMTPPMERDRYSDDRCGDAQTKNQPFARQGSEIVETERFTQPGGQGTLLGSGDREISGGSAIGGEQAFGRI